MNGQEEATIQCPYCGETLQVMIDCSISHQQYIEDCQICCRPIHFDVSISDDGDVSVIVKDENQ